MQWTNKGTLAVKKSGQTGPEGDEAGITLVLDHLHDSDGLRRQGTAAGVVSCEGGSVPLAADH